MTPWMPATVLHKWKRTHTQNANQTLILRHEGKVANVVSATCDWDMKRQDWNADVRKGGLGDRQHTRPVIRVGINRSRCFKYHSRV
jgi:hypothetical protein